jgi:hypothetical protein
MQIIVKDFGIAKPIGQKCAENIQSCGELFAIL